MVAPKKGETGFSIPEVPHTYAYHHGMFGYMNENQVAISESTIGTVRKLVNNTPSAKIDLTMLSLLGMERSSYRYEPRPDRNAELRDELVKLARQKPRYGYRRLHVLLQRRGHEVNVKRVYRLYLEERLAVRRRKRKHLVRDRALAPRLIRPNQEWAMDFSAP